MERLGKDMCEVDGGTIRFWEKGESIMIDTYEERQRQLDEAISEISYIRDSVGHDLESLRRNVIVAKRIVKECQDQYKDYKIIGTETDVSLLDLGQIALFPDPPYSEIEAVLIWLKKASKAFLSPVPLPKGYGRDRPS
jgi:hypothetical protein